MHRVMDRFDGGAINPASDTSVYCARSYLLPILQSFASPRLAFVGRIFRISEAGELTVIEHIGLLPGHLRCCLLLARL